MHTRTNEQELTREKPVNYFKSIQVEVQKTDFLTHAIVSNKHSDKEPSLI